jgi:hypothetical protein
MTCRCSPPAVANCGMRLCCGFTQRAVGGVLGGSYMGASLAVAFVSRWRGTEVCHSVARLCTLVLIAAFKSVVVIWSSGACRWASLMRHG